MDFFRHETTINEGSGGVAICVMLDSVAERPLNFVLTPIEHNDARGTFKYGLELELLIIMSL